jgi:hypothetical protein
MTELPTLPPLMERALQAARSTRSLTVLSMKDMRELCKLAVAQHDLLADISTVCTAMAERKVAIEPISLQNVINTGLARITSPEESPKS